MRLVVAEDSALLRAGLVELLTSSGFDVVGQAADAEATLVLVREARPDAVVLDIRMPPTHTLEGLVAARTIRKEHGTAIGIVLLSQYVETRYAIDLMADGAGGFGYLLKDRVLDIDELADAIRRVAAGGTAVDPVVIEHLMKRRRGDDLLTTLTDREREVLAAMAEGRSNTSIAGLLHVSPKTVEASTSRIFTKLGLPPDDDQHRRVRAVLEYLRVSR
ncbi:MAG: response regulator transcription factor [Nocardioides sp.]